MINILYFDIDSQRMHDMAKKNYALVMISLSMYGGDEMCLHLIGVFITLGSLRECPVECIWLFRPYMRQKFGIESLIKA